MEHYPISDEVVDAAQRINLNVCLSTIESTLSIISNPSLVKVSTQSLMLSGLQKFYSIVQPEKLEKVAAICKKYRGQEVKLIINLQRKYCKDPDAVIPLIQLGHDVGIKLIETSITSSALSTNTETPPSAVVNPTTHSIESKINATERALFGGAIFCNVPQRFEDVSSFRPIPDHQEVFVDVDSDQTLIIEILGYENTVDDDASAEYYFKDLAQANDASDTSNIVENKFLRPGEMPFDERIAKCFASGVQQVYKYREGNDFRNVVDVHLLNLRLPFYSTDIIISLSIVVVAVK